MSLEIIPICRECSDLLLEFAKNIFPRRPNTPEFLKWRYLDCPNQRGFLAVEDGTAVAMLGEFSKTYRYGSQDFPCLELIDWFLRPSRRGSGIGSKLIQHTMRMPETRIAIGGTAISRKLFRTNHFKEQQATRFVLPLGSCVGEGYLSRRFIAPRLLARGLGTVASLYFRPRNVKPPRNWSVIPVATIGNEVRDLYLSPNQLVQVPDVGFIRWLTTGFPTVGHFTTLYFLEGGKLRGWSLSRVFDSENGRTAMILEISGLTLNTEIYSWMISQTVQAVSGLAPIRVVAVTSSQPLASALKANRFLPADVIPISFHQKAFHLPPIGVSLLMADECLMPYPVSAVTI
jgi:GNAT superfamily N-acetyltransferase